MREQSNMLSNIVTSSLRLALAVCSVAAVPQAASAAPATPWGEMAQWDIKGVRDILAADHPGPVDPQNDFYRRWLEEGLQQANQRAAEAKSYNDYMRVLRFYVNGFRDGHISVHFPMLPDIRWWPGFLVSSLGPDQPVRVATATKEAGVPVGAELVGCDGKSVSQLMEERLDP